MIRRSKGFLNPILRQNQFAHAIVFKQDQRVRTLLQQFQRLFRLSDATAAFKTERHRCHHQHKGSSAFGDLRDHRRRTRSGATAKSRANENDLMPCQILANHIPGKQSRFTSQIRITTGPHAAHEFRTQLQLRRCHRMAQHPHVSVHANQTRIQRAIQSDAVQDIGTSAADSDDCDADGSLRSCGGV